MKLHKYIISGLAVLLLTSCETEDDKKILEAQSCLDAARDGAAATACAEKIANIESAEASMIRCGVTYLQQGFTTQRYTDAYNQLKNNTSGQDNVLALMTKLAFTRTNTFVSPNRSNTNDSNYAVNECQKSGSKGLTLLAGSTQISTLIFNTATIADPNNPTAAEMDAALGAIAAGDKSTIGTTALLIYNTSCANSSNANSEVCKTLTTAVNQGGGDVSAIGAQLLTLLDNPAP